MLVKSRFIHWKRWEEDEIKGSNDPLVCLLDTDMSFGVKWEKEREQDMYIVIAVLV